MAPLPLDAEPAPRPWDPGLQNERTSLAWQRTMLSGLACSLLVARLVAGLSLTLAIVVGFTALVGTALLGLVAVRRFRHHARALPARHLIGDGRSHLLLAGLVVGTAVAALGYVLLG